MNRNTSSHFEQIPHANIKRSQFKRPYSHLTTVNEGDLIPIMWDEVLPGDTVKIPLNAVIRMATPLYPVMDNCYADFYAFFVPNRLTWEHWEEFLGENKSSYWAETTEYTPPTVVVVASSDTNYLGWPTGTLADYMGVPVNNTLSTTTDRIEGTEVNQMPFAAYAQIWNEWFRDQNIQQPIKTNLQQRSQIGLNSKDSTEYYWKETNEYPNGKYALTSAANGITPMKVCRSKDYFSSALPEPQKGEASLLPMTGDAKIYTGTPYDITGTDPMTWQVLNGVSMPNYPRLGLDSTPESTSPTSYTTDVVGGTQYTGKTPEISPNNLYADMTTVTAATINDLRQAIAIQHLLENQARGGSRYREIILSSFGVSTPDSRMQIPEYLGGYRLPIQMNQVIQNSSTDATTPQGNAAAYSLTSMNQNICTKSFTEHGIIMVLMAIRVDHSYQQGLARKWTRKTRYDYYWPELANIGEQAILNKEIYAQANEEDDEVFGYQEAWAEYRYGEKRISGEMRSTYDQPLDAWHYADYYEELPILNSTWIQEPHENIDRTIAVQSEISHQFICDFYMPTIWTRPMPVYSVPGLETI